VLKRNATQSIADTTSEAITFPSADTTEELDSDAFHSGSTNTARITVPTGGGGWYDLGACVQFESNATGRRDIWIELNGSAGTGTVILKEIRDAAPTSQTVGVISGPSLLAAGDYITLNVLQTSGGALNVQSSGSYSIRFWALRRFVA
jgi:hypothetical protein